MGNDIIKVSRNTENAPKSSFATQSVAFSHYNNISAQLPINPRTGEIAGNTIAEQAKQCLNNLRAIVEGIDQSMNDVIKITIYIKNISDIDALDEVYTSVFQNYFPTRTIMAVDALPMDGALIQMDAVISNGVGTHPQQPTALKKVVKNTQNAPISKVSAQTVAFSHYNNISAQLPIDPKSDKIVIGGVKKQAEQCLKNIKAILQSIDVPFDDIVKTTIFLKNPSDIDAVNEVYSSFFPDSAIARTAAYVPARTVVIASGLPMDALIQIDAVISHGDGTPPQAVADRHGIVIRANNTQDAPKNTFSTQTVAFSHYNHISGQLPLEPKTDKMIAGGIKEQVNQSLKNIKAIVESIDHVMDDVVKVNIQLKNIKDIDVLNEVFTTFFKSDLPARTIIGVSALPMNALVQIDAVVSNGEGTPP
ncbi:reactive intermediate/imine deaminase [Bizionia argentinensis JUB59]|uniref:Reactive intermediate/imine deaminase n=1 Tax=Bizionia argentinensis JUB59 TaxID=1046627 RepID=G2EGD3_9FLAO|nr:RidA family protein [Bizionia argentinensis]EGV42490.1 reactive intermediate/imine deaminase [Bizionia argentinensis JUB59]